MAVRAQFGHLSKDAARCVAVRHDHGSTFMADHFQKQIRFWGLSPSYTFVGEPQTNGVIERLFRTLKEQVVHGRIFERSARPSASSPSDTTRCGSSRTTDTSTLMTSVSNGSAPKASRPPNATVCPENRGSTSGVNSKLVQHVRFRAFEEHHGDNSQEPSNRRGDQPCLVMEGMGVDHRTTETVYYAHRRIEHED